MRMLKKTRGKCSPTCLTNNYGRHTPSRKVALHIAIDPEKVVHRCPDIRLGLDPKPNVTRETWSFGSISARIADWVPQELCRAQARCPKGVVVDSVPSAYTRGESETAVRNDRWRGLADIKKIDQASYLPSRVHKPHASCRIYASGIEA